MICINVAINGFCLMLLATHDSFLHFIWMMGIEIEVLSGEGRFTIHRSPESFALCMCVTNTSRKVNLISCSFSIVNIVNCIDVRIEFTWSSNVWTSSWWGQRMNVLSMYLSHIDGFSYVDPNAISLKWFHVYVDQYWW